MPKSIDILHGDGTTETIVAPSTPFGGGGGAPSYSAEVNDILDETTDAGIRDAIGIVTYPFTTDIDAGVFVQRTQDLSSITDQSGYEGDTDLASVYVGSNVT